MSAVSPTTAESSSLRRLAEEVGAFVFGLRIADCGLSRRAAGVRPLRLTPDERCVTNDGGEQLFATACRRGGGFRFWIADRRLRIEPARGGRAAATLDPR